MDLLDRGASRQLAAAAAGRARQRRGGADDGPEFGTDAAGRMIIKARAGVCGGCAWDWSKTSPTLVAQSVPMPPLARHCLLHRLPVPSPPPPCSRA